MKHRSAHAVPDGFEKLIFFNRHSAGEHLDRKMLKGFSEGNSDMAVEALKQDLNHAATYILPRLGEAA